MCASHQPSPVLLIHFHARLLVNLFLAHYSRGKLLVTDGNQSNWIYIVKSGSLHVIKRLGTSSRSQPSRITQAQKTFLLNDRKYLVALANRRRSVHDFPLHPARETRNGVSDAIDIEETSMKMACNTRMIHFSSLSSFEPYITHNQPYTMAFY